MEPSVNSISSPSIRRSRFGEHDELASLIRGADTEFIQRSSGSFKGEFTVVGLGSGNVQFGQVALPYISRGTPSGGRTFFILHLKPEPDYLWKGRALEPGFMLAITPGAEHQDLSPPKTYWALVSFDPTALNHSLAALNGEDGPGISQGSHILLPQPELFNLLRGRLRAVHAAVNSDPSFLDVPESRRGVEESILTALALAVGSSSRVRPNGFGAVGRTRVASQVDAYLSASRGEPLYLADLCAVAGVSERTLRYIFQEMYGMSPVQYLKLRRLHQARAALRKGDPDRNTVQSIAQRCGIWHLGRFASEYKALFNEAPLQTLRKDCLIGRAAESGVPNPSFRPNLTRIPGLE